MLENAQTLPLLCGLYASLVKDTGVPKTQSFDKRTTRGQRAIHYNQIKKGCLTFL